MSDQQPSVLAFYTRPGPMTSPGKYAAAFEVLPRDIAGLVRVAQGLLIHEHIAPAYGVTLSDVDRETVHLRPVEDILAAIMSRDDRGLDIARPPAERVAGNCRHFTVLMVAMLRAQGTPARARCGFGGYFVDGAFEDHWVCEYWHAEQRRWVLVDAQVDERQRQMFPVDFDLTDVPRDRFLVAGDAWAQCRSGLADPGKFGLSLLNETGLWWIAGNLMRDATALTTVELLPWDVWGAMPTPADEIDGERQVLFDRLADLTINPDGTHTRLRQLCQDDSRFRVPPTVFNAVRGRDENI
jgi:hypothetical protein